MRTIRKISRQIRIWIFGARSKEIEMNRHCTLKPGDIIHERVKILWWYDMDRWHVTHYEDDGETIKVKLTEV